MDSGPFFLGELMDKNDWSYKLRNFFITIELYVSYKPHIPKTLLLMAVVDVSCVFFMEWSELVWFFNW